MKLVLRNQIISVLKCIYCLGYVFSSFYLLLHETGLIDRVFVLSIVVLCFSILYSISSRPIMSSFYSIMPFILIDKVSSYKQDQMLQPAMFFDLKYMIGFNLVELFMNHKTSRNIILLLMLAAVIVALSTIVAMYVENKGKPRKIIYRMFFVSMFTMIFAGCIRISEINSKTSSTDWSTEKSVHSLVSTFFYSAFWDSGLRPVSKIKSAGKNTIGVKDIRQPSPDYPNIVIILEESTTDIKPFLRPEHANWERNFTKPAGGRYGTLSVFTCGGGTQLSEFSFLTGIPNVMFGGSAPYVVPLQIGKIKTGLPAYLKQFGYRTFTQCDSICHHFQFRGCFYLQFARLVVLYFSIT